MIRTPGSLAQVIYFDAVPVVPRMEHILSRLGYSRRLTQLTYDDRFFLESSINLGLALCRNRGAAGYFPVKAHTSEAVTLVDDTRFESTQLAKFLSKSSEILLMAGTCGQEIMDRISSEMSGGSAALAVVLDAVGSRSADMILDWIMDFCNKSLSREGKRLTKHRYSPGYGDLLLSNQSHIYRLLGLKRLELKLTESMMLVPEKSVLAIAGIERI